MFRFAVRILPIILLSTILITEANAQSLGGIRFSVYGGGIATSIGESDKTGLAVGFSAVPNRKILGAPFSMRFGAEYAQKFRDRIQVMIGGQFPFEAAETTIAPYLGLAAAFRLKYSANSTYRTIDPLGLIGVEVQVDRFILDFQFCHGLVGARQSSSYYYWSSSSSSGGDYSKSYRLALGVCF